MLKHGSGESCCPAGKTPAAVREAYRKIIQTEPQPLSGFVPPGAVAFQNELFIESAHALLVDERGQSLLKINDNAIN